MSALSSLLRCIVRFITMMLGLSTLYRDTIRGLALKVPIQQRTKMQRGFLHHVLMNQQQFFYSSTNGAACTSCYYPSSQKRNTWTSTRTFEGDGPAATAPSSSDSSVIVETTTPKHLRRTRIRNILQTEDKGILGQEVVIKGWVRTKRQQKAFCFIEINDGSTLRGLQVVASKSMMGYEETMAQVTTGASMAIRGIVVESPGKNQKMELRATSLEVVGVCPAEYPLQKKNHSLEFLRQIAHLRPRTNTISAVSRVRSVLALATHEFFGSSGFQFIHTPIITALDSEGAGDLFRVTMQNHPLNDETTTTSKLTGVTPLSPVNLTENNNTAEFFGKPTYLTVSGQLAAETHACALGDVYTFGPTFRAENSQTTRHLAEFNMIEPEMAFADIHDNMDCAEGFVKYVIQKALEKCDEDLEFFAKLKNDDNNELRCRLERIVLDPFIRIRYEDAVNMLKEEIARDTSLWQFPNLTFGNPLQNEHEKWICEKKFHGVATFVYDYPRSIKAFYMRDNDDGKTVAAMDLLVPGVGELVGGSQREERLDVLDTKIDEFGLDRSLYTWYADLRRYGSVPHSGFGVGFERLVCYVTGLANIREAVAFPRYHGSAEF
eukprot:481992_1